MRGLPSKITYKGSISQMATFFIVLASMFFTFFSYNNSSMGALCIFFSVLIIILNPKNKNIFEIIPFLIIFSVVLFLLLLSGKMSERGFNAPINHVLKFAYLLFAVSLSIGIRELTNGDRKIIIKCTLISITISALISCYCAIFVDKYAIRYPDERGFTNVFNFSQLYAICIVLVSIAFVILTFYKERSMWKLLIVFIVLMGCISVSLYTTALILSVCGICLSIFINRYIKSKTKTIILSLSMIPIMLFVFVFRIEISDMLYELTEPLNWVIRDRLRSVVDTIFGTDHNLSYSHDRRDELAGYSLNSFKDNPLFGVGYKKYGYGVIGCHQEWADLLGVFGIIGMFLFIVVMIYLVVITVKKIDNKTDLYGFVIAFIMYIILGFLNPCINLPVLVAVFVIAPNLSTIFYDKKIFNIKKFCGSE